jgi:hypothetical protein
VYVRERERESERARERERVEYKSIIRYICQSAEKRKKKGGNDTAESVIR